MITSNIPHCGNLRFYFNIPPIQPHNQFFGPKITFTDDTCFPYLSQIAARVSDSARQENPNYDEIGKFSKISLSKLSIMLIYR
jgi:hypothetical protein